MIFHALGEKMLLVEFEQRIESSVHQKVVDLQDWIESWNDPTIKMLVPAYCSLAIGFDRDKTNHAQLTKRIQGIKTDFKNAKREKKRKRVVIPVCYDRQFALDAEEVESFTSMPFETLAQRHSSKTYQVFMMGFMPGFAYLGSLPDTLVCPRKTQPRTLVPKGSVAIAGRQTGIYSAPAPGGWQIIGRTPNSMFTNDSRHPFLLSAGDVVEFLPISIDEFHVLMVDSHGEANERLIEKEREVNE